MATRVHFEALYGSSSNGPVCSILRVDDLTVLLDCGWDDEYDVNLLRPIEKASFRRTQGIQADILVCREKLKNW